MASQAAKKALENDATVTKKAGRPAGKTRVFDYEKYRTRWARPEDFAAYLEGYPDKSGLMAYVYRLQPKIDFGLIGRNESNILETAQLAEMTPLFIAEKFGRGVYMLTLNDANRPGGQTEVARTWFKLNDELRPPVYDKRTLLLGHPDNVDEINRMLTIGELVRDSSGAPRLRNEADGPRPVPGAAAPAAAADASTDLLNRDLMGRVMLGLIERGTTAPRDAVRETIEVARMLIPAAPAVDVETIVERVVTRLQGAPGAGSLDPFANYERMERFISKVRGPGPGGDGVAGVVSTAAGVVEDGWAPHLGGIIQQLRGFLPEVFAGLQQLRGGSSAAAPVAAPADVRFSSMTVEQRIEEIFKIGYARMNEGVKGFDFAAWVCFHYPGGLEVYRTLEPAGALGLISLAAMNPQARGLVNDPTVRPKLEEFLMDFFSFSPDPLPDEPEANGAPAVV